MQVLSQCASLGTESYAISNDCSWPLVWTLLGVMLDGGPAGARVDSAEARRDIRLGTPFRVN